MSNPSTTIYKYHGTGNDFVIMDSPTASLDIAALARHLCDRHRGVGADGVIVVEPEAGFDGRMTIYNRDGSRPQMCGNGIRCVARHLVEAHGLEGRLLVATDAGPRQCVVHRFADRFEVDVDMGVAQRSAELAWRGGGADWSLIPVDMGNPHAVVFANPAISDVDAIGEALNSAGSPFKDGVNVEFTTVTDDSRIEVIVYERGVGRTQACGTGACAAAVAAWSTGRVVADEIVVGLPGGQLRIRMEADHVWMRGDAEFVMVAQLGAEWLQART